MYVPVQSRTRGRDPCHVIIISFIVFLCVDVEPVQLTSTGISKNRAGEVLGVSHLFQLTMRLLATMALAVGLFLPYVSAASIPEAVLRAVGDRAKLVERRGLAPSFPSGRLFDIEGRVQYFAGTNAWWLGHLTSDADLNTAMSEIAKVRQQLSSSGFINY